MNEVKLKILAASMKKSVEYVDALLTLCKIYGNCGFTVTEAIKESTSILVDFEKGWPA